MTLVDYPLVAPTQTGTRDWWLARLLPKLDAQAQHATEMQRYFRGEQGIPLYSNKRMREAARRLLSLSVTNFAELIVEAVRERMIPIGFRTGAVDDPTGDVDAWSLWQANGLDADCDLVHRAMLSMSAAYVIVGRDGDNVVITPEDPRQVYAECDPIRRRVVRAAIKVFRDDLDNRDRVYLYLPGLVHKASRPATIAEAPVLLTPDGWTWDDGGSPLPGQRVPVVPFLNKPDLFARPAAEFESHVPLLDRINYGILNRLEVSTLQAFRQRAVKGVPPFDESGNPVDYSDVFTSDPGALWLLPEGAELWESAQVDLGPIRSAIRDDVEHLAAVSRIPVHYLEPVNQSAEGVEAKREGLIFRVQDACKQTGESWEQVMSLGFEFMGDAARANRDDMEIMWADPERRTLTERCSAASQATAAGLTWRAVMSDIMQYTPQEIARMEAEKAGDTMRTALMTRASTPAAPAPAEGDDVRAKAEALGVLIRAGVNPDDAAAAVGLVGVRFTGAVPVSLRLPEDQADSLEGTGPTGP